MQMWLMLLKLINSGLRGKVATKRCLNFKMYNYNGCHCRFYHHHLLLFLFLLNQNHVCGSLTEHVVKMTGYRPSYFFVCLWTEAKSRSINTHTQNKKTEQAWSMKDLLYRSKHQTYDLWSCGTKQEMPSSNIGPSCLLTELSI